MSERVDDDDDDLAFHRKLRRLYQHWARYSLRIHHGSQKRQWQAEICRVTDL